MTLFYLNPSRLILIASQKKDIPFQMSHNSYLLLTHLSI